MSDNELENPWFVEELEEFLYFCCPECDLKDQSRENFLEHALNQHPKSKNSLYKFEIKDEPLEPLDDNEKNQIFENDTFYDDEKEEEYLQNDELSSDFFGFEDQEIETEEKNGTHIIFIINAGNIVPKIM